MTKVQFQLKSTFGFGEKNFKIEQKFHSSIAVVNHYYEAEVVSEYVIKGNTAVLKCNIPSFVADFVRVEAWLGSDGTEYTSTTDFGTAQLHQFHTFLAMNLLCSFYFFLYDFHLHSMAYFHFLTSRKLYPITNLMKTHLSV